MSMMQDMMQVMPWQACWIRHAPIRRWMGEWRSRPRKERHIHGCSGWLDGNWLEYEKGTLLLSIQAHVFRRAGAAPPRRLSRRLAVSHEFASVRASRNAAFGYPQAFAARGFGNGHGRTCSPESGSLHRSRNRNCIANDPRQYLSWGIVER